MAKAKVAKKIRTIQIFSEFVEKREPRLIAVRNADSLKKGLLDYYEETLRPIGWTKPLVTGNVLTVEMKGQYRTGTITTVKAQYTAKDAT